MAVAEWARQYVGRVFDEVTPCWGVVRAVYAEQYGLELPTYGTRCPNAADAAQVALLVTEERWREQAWHAVPLGSEKPGDVLLLRARGFPAHVGVVVGDHRMLHCECEATTACEDYHRLNWRRRIVGCYRHAALMAEGGSDGNAAGTAR
jgi:cell wall-associated NlpC family hydrolase